MKKLKDSIQSKPGMNSYLITKIDISGYERKGFDKFGLQELLKGIRNLISIRELVLKENGISDNCQEEICELISNPKIAFMDLSSNRLGRHSAQAMAKALGETYHLIWFE